MVWGRIDLIPIEYKNVSYARLYLESMQNKKCAVHISSDKGQFQQNTIIIKQPSNKDNLPRKLSDDAAIQGL